MHPNALATHTRAALLTIARQQGLTGVSRLRKKDLLDILTWLLTVAEPPTASEIKSRIVAVNPPRRRKILPKKAQELSSSSVAVAQSSKIPEAPAVLPPTPPTVMPMQDAAESKFFLGAQTTDPLAEPDTLPASYDDNRVVLLARDPHWLYAYWDFSIAHLNNLQGQFGAMTGGLVLKLFDVTHIEFTGANAWSSTEIRLTPFATNWYIPVPQADTAYCVEIGYYSREGRFVALGRSNAITTPRAELVATTEVQWFTPPELRPTSLRSGSALPPPFVQEDRDGQKATTGFPNPETTALTPAEHPFSWGAEHRR